MACIWFVWSMTRPMPLDRTDATGPTDGEHPAAHCFTSCFVTSFCRAVSRQDFATTYQSIGAVGWRNQPMASRLTDLSQASEANQISHPPPSPPAEGTPPKKGSLCAAFSIPSYHENSVRRIVSTSWKRLLGPTCN